MPAVWNDDDFTEGGLASVIEFIGKMTGLDEDVEGQYGDQIELHFEDVEIVEAGDGVTLDEGRLTSWVSQSNKKNSTNGRMFADWIEFAKAHDMGPLPSCFFGVLMRYKKATYEFGQDMNPGRAFIPVEVIEEGGKKTKAKKSGAKASAKPAKSDPPPAEEDDDEGNGVPEVLVEAIHKTIGEDGATQEMIRRVIKQKAVLRKALAEFGELGALLTAMEDTIDEDEGTYTRVEADEDDPV
ncbi:hypothetical protein LCGC14_0363690 [marine sediment metagenome]|uniref:Uncharacterized protein n=1 Tax=marine sediment metagenome TaxID=412755 RepID=A0A0F9T721_9ZZZZ